MAAYQVHDDALVHLLPEMGTENLDERDLECGNLAVHEDSCEIKLYLEADVHICTVNCWAPPQGESSIGNLVQTTALCVGQLLVLHGLLKSRGFLPEQPLPSGKVRALE